MPKVVRVFERERERDMRNVGCEGKVYLQLNFFDFMNDPCVSKFFFFFFFVESIKALKYDGHV